MNHIYKIILISILVLLVSNNLQAEETWDGNWFLAQCGEPNLPCVLLIQGYNAGYLTGVHHGVYAGFKELKDAKWTELEENKKLRHKVVNDWAWCIPEGGKPQQLVSIIVKWYENNPDKLHLKIPDVAPVALSKALPCK